MRGAASHALGVSEGLVLGAKAGSGPDLLLDVLLTSSGTSRALEGARTSILARNLDPGIAIDLMAKDARLATELAQLLGVCLLAGSLANQEVIEAIAAGLGELGTPAQIQVFGCNAYEDVRTRRGWPRD